jgi:hypothetical protein
MRVMACILGWLFVLATLAVAGWEVLSPDEKAGVQLRPAGELWYRLDAASLNLVQAVIERYIWPPLWDPVLSSLLHLPAIVIPAVPGLVLVVLCHARTRRKRGKRRFR